jgi:uncharacterized sulfatase
VLNGTSLKKVFENPQTSAGEATLVNFHRFAIKHDSYGEFYPVRCSVDRRNKLIVNLFETDELYDLAEDPFETENRIDDPALSCERDRLHDWLLEEMDRVRAPFRSVRWANRSWRRLREPFCFGGARRNRPRGFPFQPAAVDG